MLKNEIKLFFMSFWKHKTLWYNTFIKTYACLNMKNSLLFGSQSLSITFYKSILSKMWPSNMSKCTILAETCQSVKQIVTNPILSTCWDMKFTACCTEVDFIIPRFKCGLKNVVPSLLSNMFLYSMTSCNSTLSGWCVGGSLLPCHAQ